MKSSASGVITSYSIHYTKLYDIDLFAEKQRGFSINAAIFFRFAQPIDPASLPAVIVMSYNFV